MTKSWSEVLSRATDLQLLYEDAKEHARQSPCVRRKYGVVISYEDESGVASHIHGTNLRVSRCCNGNLCARERYVLNNGERVEIGAEIHAEQVALIGYTKKDSQTNRIIIACLDSHNREVFGPTAFPCHTCALMIQYAGFKQVYVMMEPSILEPISIWDIIEHREREWGQRDGA